MNRRKFCFIYILHSSPTFLESGLFSRWKSSGNSELIFVRIICVFPQPGIKTVTNKGIQYDVVTKMSEFINKEKNEQNVYSSTSL